MRSLKFHRIAEWHAQESIFESVEIVAAETGGGSAASIVERYFSGTCEDMPGAIQRGVVAPEGDRGEDVGVGGCDDPSIRRGFVQGILIDGDLWCQQVFSLADPVLKIEDYPFIALPSELTDRRSAGDLTSAKTWQDVDLVRTLGIFDNRANGKVRLFRPQENVSCERKAFPMGVLERMLLEPIYPNESLLRLCVWGEKLGGMSPAPTTMARRISSLFMVSVPRRMERELSSPAADVLDQSCVTFGIRQQAGFGLQDFF